MTLYCQFRVTVLARAVCRSTGNELVEAQEFTTTGYTSWGYSEEDVKNSDSRLLNELNLNVGYQFTKKLEASHRNKLKDQKWYLDSCILNVKPVPGFEMA